jgi:hypothetical protein
VRIKESKNLKYDKIAREIGAFGDYDMPEPKVCILEKFNRLNGRIDLYFENRSQSVIRSRNIEGERELDLIEKKLPDFMGRSYEEILNADF